PVTLTEAVPCLGYSACIPHPDTVPDDNRHEQCTAVSTALVCFEDAMDDCRRTRADKDTIDIVENYIIDYRAMYSQNCDQSPWNQDLCCDLYGKESDLLITQSGAGMMQPASTAAVVVLSLLAARFWI
ncbi:hypothetical protein BaRGS_00022106, partial [Batillaria attramentaria]